MSEQDEKREFKMIHEKGWLIKSRIYFPDAVEIFREMSEYINKKWNKRQNRMDTKK